MRKIAIAVAGVLTLLAAIFGIRQASLGGAHQGEVFYLCWYKTTTSMNSELSNVWGPCKAPQDRSAYFAPVLYRNGTAIKPNKFHLYLRNMVAATPTSILPPSWVVGSAKATAPQTEWTNRYFWQCGDTKASTHYATPPNCPNAMSGQGEDALTLIVKFPQCWSGSTWSYPVSGRCPLGTQLTLQIQEHIQYKVADGASAKMTLSTGSIYGVHAGFINGFDQATLKQWIAQCIETGKSCHVRSDGTIS
jgi:hypothetical protein